MAAIYNLNQNNYYRDQQMAVFGFRLMSSGEKSKMAILYPDIRITEEV
jgi:hypothetical protein